MKKRRADSPAFELDETSRTVIIAPRPAGGRLRVIRQRHASSLRGRSCLLHAVSQCCGCWERLPAAEASGLRLCSLPPSRRCRGPLPFLAQLGFSHKFGQPWPVAPMERHPLGESAHGGR